MNLEGEEISLSTFFIQSTLLKHSWLHFLWMLHFIVVVLVVILVSRYFAFLFLVASQCQCCCNCYLFKPIRPLTPSQCTILGFGARSRRTWTHQPMGPTRSGRCLQVLTRADGTPMHWTRRSCATRRPFRCLAGFVGMRTTRRNDKAVLFEERERKR